MVVYVYFLELPVQQDILHNYEPNKIKSIMRLSHGTFIGK